MTLTFIGCCWDGQVDTCWWFLQGVSFVCYTFRLCLFLFVFAALLRPPLLQLPPLVLSLFLSHLFLFHLLYLSSFYSWGSYKLSSLYKLNVYTVTANSSVLLSFLARMGFAILFYFKIVLILTLICKNNKKQNNPTTLRQKKGGGGISVCRARDSWWGDPGFDLHCGRPLPTGWVGVSIMWTSETEVMVSPLCLVCGRT